MKYRYIAYDIDGTLLNTAPADLAGLQEVLREELGMERPIAALTGALGIPSRDILRVYGAPEGDVDRLARLWMERMHDHFECVDVFPGTREALEALRARGVRLGVVTSKNSEEYAQDFVPFGLETYFDTIVTADDTALHKPHAEPLLKFLERLGAKREEALYIGDSTYDRDCARAAGVDFALAVWGSFEPGMEGVQRRLARPEDVLALLEG